MSLKDFQVWYETAQKRLFETEIAKLEEANYNYQKKIVDAIMSHVNSGKGFTAVQIEENLLRCFLVPEAIEIIKISDDKKRINQMLQLLSSRKLIGARDASTLSFFCFD